MTILHLQNHSRSTCCKPQGKTYTFLLQAFILNAICVHCTCGIAHGHWHSSRFAHLANRRTLIYPPPPLDQMIWRRKLVAFPATNAKNSQSTLYVQLGECDLCPRSMNICVCLGWAKLL